MRLKSKRQYLVEIEGCPRCGHDHVGGKEEGGEGALLFTRLANPETRNDLWAFCPETTQPVLVSSEDIDEEDD